MGKKKNNNNNKQHQEETVETVEAVADAVVDVLKGEKHVETIQSQSAESSGETPADTPTAPPTQTTRVEKKSEVTTEETVKKVTAPTEKYTIVPTPVEETASQRVAGYYRRRDNNERTEKEAAEEEAHFARLETLKGEERVIAERSWAHKPGHILLDVAFANNEKFARLYLEAQQEAFVFMASSDLQRGKASIQQAQRERRAAYDAVSREEFNSRNELRKQSRDELNSLIVDNDTARRAVLAADREAKRRARTETLPAAPEGLDSQNDYNSASQQAGSD